MALERAGAGDETHADYASMRLCRIMVMSAHGIPPIRPHGRTRSGPWSGERTLVIAIAVTLVAFRTLVFFFFEQLNFDSDQAIIGLMAKHLAEGRAFPLFFYGQSYMLGVEAWVAAPFFLVAGPTVDALRASMLVWNAAFVALLIIGLERGAGLRPWVALVPALFFAVAPPSVARHLVEAQGGIIEPFVYIALLWFLRDRPIWFGAALGIGFLNREFTLYAVPVLLFLETSTGQLTAERLRHWLLAMVAFFAVWESVEVLRRLADPAGPGTRGALIGGFGGSQITNLLNRFNWQSGTLAERVGRMGPDILAWFGGARQVDTGFPVADRGWLLWLLGAGAVLVAARVLFLLARGSRPGTSREAPAARRVQAQIARSQFALYVLGVGVLATTAFIAGKPVLQGYSRYVTLGLLIPVGLTASMLSLEVRAGLRHLVVALVIGWAAIMTADHGHVLMTYLRTPPPDPARRVADRLVAEGVQVAAAGYWQAYKITFLARERVKVASLDFVRIREYQTLAAAQPDKVVVIRDTPCPGGEAVATFYLCKPGL